MKTSLPSPSPATMISTSPPTSMSVMIPAKVTDCAWQGMQRYPLQDHHGDYPWRRNVHKHPDVASAPDANRCGGNNRSHDHEKSYDEAEPMSRNASST